MRTFHFYIDDSGTRHPDHGDSNSGRQPNWFSLGGVIIEESEEDDLKATIQVFKDKWKITGPLHSSPIRQRKGDFAWLKDDEVQTQKFFDDLEELLVSAPVIGHGCVIDRTSYNLRYKEKYGRDRWSLCNTAFTIAVERAAKYAMRNGGRLRVFVESSSKPDEKKLQHYYHEMRGVGNPFHADRSSGYAPLEQEDLNKTLFEFRVKQKSSPIMQLADLYLYPISRGRYESEYEPYRVLCSHQKLIDQHLDESEVAILGIKYSCFDMPADALKRHTSTLETQKSESLTAIGPLAATL